MEENKIFQDQTEKVMVVDEQDMAAVDGKKPLDVAALVLSIVTVVFAFLSPLVSYVCGIIGLVFAIKHRKEKRTTVALVLCIVGIIGAAVSHVIAAKYMAELLQTYFE